jgi:hypothetical protein
MSKNDEIRLSFQVYKKHKCYVSDRPILGFFKNQLIAYLCILIWIYYEPETCVYFSTQDKEEMKQRFSSSANNKLLLKN